MKQVIDYNLDYIQHLTIVLNGKKIWAHFGAICSKIVGMFFVTQATFAHVIQSRVQK
jgi:hypothetical protein